MAKKKIIDTHGNRECLDLAKQIIHYVRTEPINWLGFVACRPGDQIGYGYAGTGGSLNEAMKGLQVLLQQTQERYKERITGQTNPNLDASYHEYNLATDPINFDFLVWLIDAEMIRRRNKAPWPLRVGFSHEAELNDRGRKFFAAVHKPLLNLVGAVEDPEAIGGSRAALFTPTQICLAARRGEEVPILQANGEAKAHVKGWVSQWGQERPPITITLREGSHWSKRNSNIEAWVRLARDLQAKGEFVVFVRDTEKANEPIEDFITYPSASYSIQPRMALYELAKCNLYVSNGPAGLGLFSGAPYLYFLRLRRDEEYEPNNPEWWVRANGIGDGDQWPWAKPGQHMIWSGDDYKSLCEGWEKYGPA